MAVNVSIVIAGVSATVQPFLFQDSWAVFQTITKHRDSDRLKYYSARQVAQDATHDS